MIDKAKEKIEIIYNILKDYGYKKITITKSIMYNIFSLFKDKEEFLFIKNIIENCEVYYHWNWDCYDTKKRIINLLL